MLSEAVPVARPAQRPAPVQATWDSDVSDAEKIRVLAGFHDWVLDKIASVQSENDNAPALQQVMHEIVGAAGLVTTLLSDKR